MKHIPYLLRYVSRTLKTTRGIISVSVLVLFLMYGVLSSSFMEKLIVPELMAYFEGKPAANIEPEDSHETTAALTAVGLFEPSFDCGRAQSWREVYICSNLGELVASDQRLSRAYRDLFNALSNEKGRELRDEQRNWLKGAENCKSIERPTQCLEQLTERRIHLLEKRLEALR